MKRDPNDTFTPGVLSHYKHLTSLAMKYARDRDRAADIVQQTMLRAFEAQHQFKPGTNLKAWLSTILFNIFAQEWRRAKRMVEDPDDVKALALVDERTTNPEIRLELLETLMAIQKLSQDKRLAIEAMIEGLEYEQAAAAMGINIGTLKSRLSRARRELAGKPPENRRGRGPGPLPGTKPNRLNLTSAQIIEIRNDPRPLKRIATQWHCSASWISLIKNRHVFKHVPDGESA